VEFTRGFIFSVCLAPIFMAMFDIVLFARCDERLRGDKRLEQIAGRTNEARQGFLN
jgi:hypothetical protein